MFSSDDYSNITESWYSGKGTYRTTVSGRKVRWDEDEATDDRVSDMLQKKREEANKAAAKARLAAKGKLPIRKPQQNEEFESYVENLQNEGYDLSNWTWEGIEEYYVNEAKKMKGEDPCWKGYQMVGTKKKGGKEVPNCVPKEEIEYIDERKYDKDEKLPSGKTPSEKMYRKRAQHGARVMLGNPALGRHPRKDPERDSYRERAHTMDTVKDAQDAGEEPRDSSAWKNTIAARRRPRASYERPNERPGGLRAKATKAGGYRAITRKEEFEAVVEYLFVEGYSDSIESAEIMAENISELWVNEIVEGYVDLNKKKDEMSRRANRTLFVKGDWERANKIEKAKETHDSDKVQAKEKANKERGKK